MFAIGLLLVTLFVAGIAIDFAPLAALQVLGGFALMVVGPPTAIVLASQRRVTKASLGQPPGE